MKYKTIDLFCGIGGIRRAFEMTGHFINVLSAEIDKYACITYEHLFGENPYNDVSTEKFKNTVNSIEYDVLLAGFPCQSFSIAGKRKGFKDSTRGTLFFEIADILSMTKPKAFLLENVEGLITHQKGETFETIINILVNELGYKVVGVNKNIFGGLHYEKKSFLRNAKDFGIPQKRLRTYIIGFREDLVADNYILKELPESRKDLNLYKNLNDLLDYKNDIEYYVASGYLETLEKHKENHSKKGNGFGYEIVNVTSIKNPISNTILATGGSGKERNLVLDPQPKFYGKIVSGKKTPINNKGIRHMTPNEWGKLQGFINYAFIKNEVETFSFPEGISKTQQYKQFGNSVCIPVVEELAKYIFNTLEELNEKI